MTSLDQIKQAAEKIGPLIRRTPMMTVTLDDGLDVTMKLEAFQLSGSFKIRGALNTVLSLSAPERAAGLVTASGGNHGLGVATAAGLTNSRATIFLPLNTPAKKVAQLKNIADKVIVEGEVWDDANKLALEFAKTTGATYVHPFADERVIAGQGTLGLEILEQAPDLDVLIVSIGGGGLIAGVSAAVKLMRPDITIIGVEPVGAPTLHNSRQAGEVITLPKITTRANTLAPKRSDALNHQIITEYVDDIVLVDDQAMEDAARWLWSNCGLAVELSAAAGVAALQSGALKTDPKLRYGCILCGSGQDGIV